MNFFKIARRVALGSLFVGASALAQEAVPEVQPAAPAVEAPPPCYFKDRPCKSSNFVFAFEAGGGAFVEGHPFAFGKGTGSGTSPGPAWGVRVGYEFTRWFAIEAHYSGTMNLINKDYSPAGPARLVTNALLAELRFTAPTPYIQPYLFFGGGLYGTSTAGDTYAARTGSSFHSSTEFGLPMGVGFSVPVTEHMALGLEATHHFFLGESFSENEELAGGDLTNFTAVVRFRL